jgi:SAM-dependent methyltransferase
MRRRIVDIGCGPGSLLQRAADDPQLHESDLYGIELARPLYEECLHRRRQGRFANPNVFFYQRNVLRDPVFDDRSIDTTITVALTHEIRSYLGADALRLLAERIYRHTRPGGVWINVDVAGPRNGDDAVWLTLDPPTTERFASFAREFRAEEGEAPWPNLVVNEHPSGTTFELTRRLAMEFLAKKDYTDNWQSEMHERFCDLDIDAWHALLTNAGFSVSPASSTTTNEWLVEHRFAPVARLTAPGQPRTPLPWPDTHVRLVATRPLAS